MPKSHYLPTRFQFVFAITALLLAAIIAGTAYLYSTPFQSAGSSGTALVGGPFSLTDQTGRRVTEKDFMGKYTLIFFGYTFCPDVCPTELQVMSAALESMGSKADRILPVFITVDPARDTPEVVRQYVSNFHPRLMGLTGTQEQIAAAAKAYRVFYARAENKADPANYLMDHSSILYLMAPDGSFLKHFSYTTDSAELAQALEKAIAP
jgi:cytochrome oxidase Cu insertion factor (SCO1/SenC/PrrC family)